MEPELISVVIPVFNRGAWLEECLESVQQQTYPKLEIVVVDDGSTDPYTREVLNRVQSKGVRVPRQSNRGPGAARNAGVRHSSGEWIFFLDSDNCLFPGTLEICHRAAVCNPHASIVYNNLCQFGEVEGPHFFPTYNLWRLLQENFMDANGLVHRRVFESGHWYDEIMRQGYEDWEFHLRLGLNGFYGINAPGTLVRYRQSLSSYNKVAQSREFYLRGYIQEKHIHVFGNSQALAEIKRTWSPALTVAWEVDANLLQSGRLPTWLNSQTFQDFEVLVGAGSAPGLAAQDPWVHLGVQQRTRAESRARLIRGSRGKYIFVPLEMPANWQPTASLFERVVRFLEAHPNAAAVLGLADSGTAGPRTLAKFHRFSQAELKGSGPLAFVCYRQAGIMAGDQYRSKLDGGLLDLDVVQKMIGRNQEAYATSLGILNREMTEEPSPGGVERHKDDGECFETFSASWKRLRHSHHPESVWAATRPREITDQELLSLFDIEDRREVPDSLDFWFRATQTPLYYAGELCDRQPQPWSGLRKGRSEVKTCVVVAAPDSPYTGANRLAADLVRGLSASYRVHICTVSEPESPWIHELLKNPRVEWWHGPELGKVEDLIEVPLARERRVLLVAVEAAWCAPVLSVMHKKYPGLRVVAHLRGQDMDPQGRFCGAVPRLAAHANSIERFVVNSKRLCRDLITRYAVPSNKILLIPPGIDARLTARTPRHTGSRTTRVVWVGRFCQEKNPTLFIDIADHLANRLERAPLEFVMIGDGELRGRVEACIRERRLSKHIRLTGWLAPEQVIDHLMESDIFVSTSLANCASYSILEAMYVGLSVVAPRVSDLEELLGDGRGELVVSQEDPEAYAHAIYALATNRSQRVLIGEKARQFVREQNGLEPILNAYARLMGNAIGKEEFVAPNEGSPKGLINGESASVSLAIQNVFGESAQAEKRYQPHELIYFSPQRNFSPEEEAHIRVEVKRLSPFFQGPFPITSDLVISGAIDCRPKWNDVLSKILPPDLEGQRVLEIGCNAGYDSFCVQHRRPQYLLAIEPATHFYEQACFLNSVYRTPVDFRCLGWETLSKEVYSEFDWVFCLGLLYHEQSPMELLKRLSEMTTHGGTLVLGTAILSEESGSPIARFVERSYRGDPTYWWIPDEKCVEAMLRAMGFTDVHLVSKHPDASLNPKDPALTVEGLKVEEFGFFVAHKLAAAELPYVHPGSLVKSRLPETASVVQDPSRSSEIDHYRQELARLRRELDTVHAILRDSLSYQLFRQVSRVASALFPPSSSRRRYYEHFKSFLRRRLSS